tara:strand:- start:8452 stop:9456 length:1005 start_codon:yes stop_codon:yes gene_type:complete
MIYNINDLKKISYLIGKDKNLTQCAGGNTSFKNKNYLIIKSSGKWLADANKLDIFTKINISKIKEKVLKLRKLNQFDLLPVGKNNYKASIETPLHLLFNYKFVVHYHPVDVNCILIKKNCDILLKNKINFIKWKFVKYFKPGFNLYKEVGKKLKKDKNIKIVFLQNHGIFIAGNNTLEISKYIRKINKEVKFKETKFNYNKIKLKKYAKILNMKVPQYKKINSLATNTKSFEVCNTKTGILFPDQAVFLGKKMNCIEEKDLKKTKLNNSSYLIIKKVGVLINKKAKIEVVELLLFISKVLLRLNKINDINYLTKNEVASLVNWSEEKYRLNIKR